MTQKPPYVPALGLDVLTPLYDPLVALTTRERTFKRVLNLACGTGTLAVRLTQAVPGAIVVGIDGDQKMLGRARRKAAQAGVEMRFDLGLSDQLMYADGSFERVLSSLFFHHLRPDEKRATLREAFRVLAPGGQLHVADWGKPPNPVLRAMFYAVQLLDGFPNTRDNVQGRLGRFIEEAGFKEVSMPARLNTPLGTIALYRAEKS